MLLRNILAIQSLYNRDEIMKYTWSKTNGTTNARKIYFPFFYVVTDNTWPFDDKQSSYNFIDYLIVFSSRVLDHGLSIYHDRVNYRVMEKLISFAVFYRKFGEKKHMNEVAWVISWNMYEHFGFMT